MVTYGPWGQDGDFDEVVTWTPTQARRVLADEGYTGYGGALLPEDEHEAVQAGSYSIAPYEELPTMLQGQIAEGKYEAAPFVSWVSLSYGGAEFLPGNEYVSRSKAAAGWSVTPLVVGRPSAAPSGVVPFYWGPDVWPDNAVDVEFENGTGIAEWLEVSLDPTTVLSGIIYEKGPTNLDQWPSVAGAFRSDIAVGIAGEPVGSIMTYDENDYQQAGSGFRATRPLGGPSIDLSEFIPPGPNSNGLPLAMATKTFVPVRNAPTGDASEWQWTYGWGWHQARLRWTLRPPRYRFVYDDDVPDTAPAPRRIFPRSDGLGAGPARTFPRPRSVQGSNRTSGGYL